MARFATVRGRIGVAPRSSCSLRRAFLRSFATHREKARFAAAVRLLVVHVAITRNRTARPHVA